MADHVADLCAQLIRFDTSNRGNGDAEGEREAAEHVAAHLTDAGLRPVLLERTPRRSNVIARVPGTDPEVPALLVQAHLDVVPADPSEWTRPPFAGEIHDGYVWGRGATDMKDMAAMMLALAHQWAAEGSRPRRDIVLAFVADEEDTGVDGAHWLVEDHPSLFDGCAAAISESGGFTHHVDGVRLYPIGTAERGTAHLKLTATGRAGHGSRRNPDNAVTHLVNTVARIAAHHWPVHLTAAVTAFLEATGAALGVPVDLRDDAAVDATIARLGAAAPLVENTVRASATPTVLRAGYKVNVIPGTAIAEIDTRTLPGIEDEVLATIHEHLDAHVHAELTVRQDGVQAPIEGPWFAAMADALRAEDPEAVVVPYCMGGGTDAKAFTQLGIDCYGFAPLSIPQGFNHRALAHGVDERVPITGLEFGVRVLNRFLLS